MALSSDRRLRRRFRRLEFLLQGLPEKAADDPREPRPGSRGAPAIMSSSPRSPSAPAGWRARASRKGPRASSGSFRPGTRISFFRSSGRNSVFSASSSSFLIYFFFLARLSGPSGKSRDRAGMYIVFMVACMLTFQFLVNVMMIVGLFPDHGHSHSACSAMAGRRS